MENLANQIKSKLESCGFACEFEDTIWIKDVQKVIQGATLIVNGQPIQQEPSYKNITMIFEILYECTVKDEEKVDKSLMCKWEVVDDGNETQYIEINIYPDEFDFFNTLCNKIFGI